MQKVEVQVFDDMDGSPADETVAFSYDGRAYEIDLSAKHAAQMRKAFQSFIDHGRQVRGLGRQRRQGRTLADRERSREIRGVLMASGYPVAERGRLPESALEEFGRLQEAADHVSELEPAPRSARRARKPAATVTTSGMTMDGSDGTGSARRTRARAKA